MNDQASSVSWQESLPSQVKQTRKGRSLLLILIGVGIGIAGDRLIPNLMSSPGVVTPRPTAQAPFSRIGDRIVVPAGSPLRSRLVLAEPLMKEVSRTLVLPALVEADPARTVKVVPPVTGRVIELKVQLGGRVVQGQELAIIDSGDLAQAYADIEKSNSALELAKKTVDRQLALEKSGGGSVREREQAQSDHSQAVAEFERAGSRLRALGISTDQKQQSRLLSLKAPVSGSIIDLQMASGSFLNDTAAAIMTIANLDTIWVTANVPEKDISFVSEDQSVTVTFPAYTGRAFDGKVLFISDVLEPDTRRTKVRIAFDNPARLLKPGMFANATFNAPALTRLVVPTSALLMSNDQTSIFVEVAPWAFERRNVETEFEEGDTAVIKTGLKPGERVIVRGGVVLND